MKNIISPSISTLLDHEEEEGSAFDVSYTSSPFGIAVSRKGSNMAFFNSTPSATSTPFSGLIFSNQYLEMSTQLQDDAPSIYGLGEHMGDLKSDISGDLGALFSLFSRDRWYALCALPFHSNVMYDLTSFSLSPHSYSKGLKFKASKAKEEGATCMDPTLSTCTARRMESFMVSFSLTRTELISSFNRRL